MAKSPMKHKEPIIGSLHWPYRETGMRGSEPLPVVGFLFNKIHLEINFNKFIFMNKSKKIGLIILLVAVIFTVGYLTKKKELLPSLVKNQTNFELQNGCSTMSATFKKENFPNSTYKNNYSVNHEKCFIEIITIKRNNQIGGWDYSAEVKDVSTGPAGYNYAALEMYVDYDLKGSALGVPDVCGITSACEIVPLCYVGSTPCAENLGSGSKYYSFNRLVQETYGIY